MGCRTTGECGWREGRVERVGSGGRLDREDAKWARKARKGMLAGRVAWGGGARGVLVGGCAALRDG